MEEDSETPISLSIRSVNATSAKPGRFRITPAEVVDHRVEIAEHPDLRLEWRTCRRCEGASRCIHRTDARLGKGETCVSH